MTRLKVKWYGQIPVTYRPNSSDERVLAEVIDRRDYHKPRAKFDVEPGEHWLDLGANIGAFAVYCKLRGATCECYEPEPGNFTLLKRNADGFACEEAAVTAGGSATVTLCVSPDLHKSSRASVHEIRGMEGRLRVRNVSARLLSRRRFDGVKMDVEGAEGPILDEGLIPACKKFVVEYHTSRDHSADNLKRRVTMLKRTFPHVWYRPEYDKLMGAGGEIETFFDRLIFCWH